MNKQLSAAHAQAFRAFLLSLAVVFICIGSSPSMKTNSDVGDPAQLTAIRHDVPILLEARLASSRKTPVIKWVVADSSRAVAAWDAGDIGGLLAMALRSGRWRIVAESSRDNDGWWSPVGDMSLCTHNDLSEPSAQDLVNADLIDAKLLTSLEPLLLPNVPSTPRESKHVDCYYVEAFQFANGYELHFRPHYNEDTRMEFWFVEPAASGPGDLLSSGDSFHFSVRAHDWSDRPSSAIATVRDGEVSIWAPFVLDPERTYVLRIEGVVPSFGAINAAVKDNTLTFNLPQFTMRAGTVAQGVVRVNL